MSLGIFLPIWSNLLIKEGYELVDRAYMRIIPTPHTISTNRVTETSGMMILSAAPILSDAGEILSVLYGGILLNHNYEIVDHIRNIIYENEKYNDKNVGAVTIFLRDVRISTNVKAENGERGVGTIVSEDVYRQVLIEGKTWIERAFAIDNWYLTAYEPIKNISGERDYEKR